MSPRHHRLDLGLVGVEVAATHRALLRELVAVDGHARHRVRLAVRGRHLDVLAQQRLAKDLKHRRLEFVLELHAADQRLRVARILRESGDLRPQLLDRQKLHAALLGLVQRAHELRRHVLVLHHRVVQPPTTGLLDRLRVAVVAVEEVDQRAVVALDVVVPHELVEELQSSGRGLVDRTLIPSSYSHVRTP
eukprot:2801097-Rhodomonas_salina.4